MNFERETELVDVSNNSFESSIDFVQTVCFDADDYDNGLFLDSLVDHDAAAINGPIIQNGEINDIVNPTNLAILRTKYIRFVHFSMTISPINP